MATEVVVPTLGESVTEATVAKWLKKVGDAISADDLLVELETDKVTVEVPAPQGGVLEEIIAGEGAEVAVGSVLARIGAGNGQQKAAAKPEGLKKAESEAKQPAAKADPKKEAARPAASDAPLAPSVRKLVEENKLDPAQIEGSGKDGRLTKGDVLSFLEAPRAKDAPKQEARPPRETGPREERVKMTRLRQAIARRLKEAQDTAAMLTTFNEVDMTAIMDLRNQYKEAFEQRHGVKLGFMSFFVKAAVVALKEFPAVNAEIDGTDIIYKNFYDIGVAVGGPAGLVVPVVRDCDEKSFAEIEKDIAEYGKKARDGKLTMDEMAGGTFTISNGGVYGSLMSTPILNPPQSGILGMHKTQQRPMVLPNGSIAARPMMYLALSYDHRIVDGKEAVSFLVRLKECIEDPSRIMLAM